MEDRMSDLVAVAYPDEAIAGEVAQTLMELQKEHSIELDDLAVAVRQHASTRSA
jgi:uncharacterized membrane protein